MSPPSGLQNGSGDRGPHTSCVLAPTPQWPLLEPASHWGCWRHLPLLLCLLPGIQAGSLKQWAPSKDYLTAPIHALLESLAFNRASAQKSSQTTQRRQVQEGPESGWSVSTVSALWRQWYSGNNRAHKLWQGGWNTSPIRDFWESLGGLLRLLASPVRLG